MTLSDARTPEDWITAVHQLPIDEFATRLGVVTRKACGMGLPAAGLLLALDALGDGNISSLHTRSGHRPSLAQLDAMVTRGHARLIDAPKRSWRITLKGKTTAEAIRRDVSALMVRLTTRRSA